MSNRNPKTFEELQSLPPIRVSSMIGPCFTRRLIRRNKSGSVTTGGWSCNFPPAGHLMTETHSACWVHEEPCERCTDHPQTLYPRGYEG